MKKYIFDRKFKFEDFPKIWECQKKYVDLIDKSYEIEGLRDDGLATDEQLEEIEDEVTNYFLGEYASTVYNEFYGKGLVLMERRTKEKINFDEYFGSDFNKLSPLQKDILASIIFSNWGYILPAEYYNKHENIVKN